MLRTFTNKIRLFFLRDKESYLRFYRLLGFYPRNLHYYEQALLHKSLSEKGSDGTHINNERLEFLGDAVLELIITDILFNHFKQEREGFLTNARSKIVKRETLNYIGRKIGLDKIVKCEIHVDNRNSYLCGNAFEALLGAIYLDQGYKACRRFIEKKILNQYLNLEQTAYREENHKSRLLEWAQRHQVHVSFELMEQVRDKNNNQIFHSLVILQGIPCTQGKGYSKKESHQEASRKALKKLAKDSLFCQAVFEKVQSDTLQSDSVFQTQEIPLTIGLEEKELAGEKII